MKLPLASFLGVQQLAGVLSLPDPRPWIALTRPRVLVLVTFTGLPALALGQHGWPSPLFGLSVLGLTALVGASCSVLNAVLERDLDAQMARTQRRPLPAGVIRPAAAVVYGLLLGGVAVGALSWLGGWLAGALGLGTILFYVGLYTGWLKRRTPQNIVIGGAAGATAPLIADAAVSGQVGLGSALLFLLIFLWTPAHFWAIALYRKQEYAAAGIPMMPIVAGEPSTRRQMLVYGLLTVGCSFVLPALGLLGWVYTATAVVLGVWFIGSLVRLVRRADSRAARATFMVSNLYLLLLFLAVVIDLAWTVG